MMMRTLRFLEKFFIVAKFAQTMHKNNRLLRYSLDFTITVTTGQQIKAAILHGELYLVT